MPEWLSTLDAAILLALASAALAAYRWHIHTKRDIADLRKQIEANEADDAARDDRLKQEFQTALAHERQLTDASLENHAKEDHRMADDIKQIKGTISDIWSTCSRIDKAVAALAAKQG